jgi:tetratricopeptide (TPR) repeat protein
VIETGLVYIHSIKPAGRFVGCGALVEGGYVATCRHVWRMATEAAAKQNADEPLEVEIEYPRSREAGATIKSSARLADGCEGVVDPSPDLVLLLPTNIPSGVMTLQLAASERHEVGEGHIHAGLVRRYQNRSDEIRDVRIAGTIAELKGSDGRRQFTGSNPQSYWSERGSSGSPLFVGIGQQLAGILSLSELGANEGESPLHEAFIVPGTTIRSYLSRLAAKQVATRTGIDLAELRPVLDSLGVQEVPVSEIPRLLKQFVDGMRARADEPVGPSNDGADIEAVIGASRVKLRDLDTVGAIEVLQAKINEEEEARVRRLVPLLKERAEVERLAFDYDAAKATLVEITRHSSDISVWIELGDLWRTTGALDHAANAYRGAEEVARRTGDERGLGVSQERIGDMLRAQGDGEGALAAYRAGLAIVEALARRDPANTQWQRDLSVSQNKIGDMLSAQGDGEGALAAYRAGLAIAEALARRDPANSEWQRDLSVSQDNIGDMLSAQGDGEGALAAYRAGLAIRETLARHDPANAQWQRDLIVSFLKISENEPAEARACLSRALDVAHALKTAGRLVAVDAWIPDELARRLAAVKIKARNKSRKKST